MIFSIAWFIVIFSFLMMLSGITVYWKGSESLLSLIKIILAISVVLVSIDIVRSGTLIIRFIASCLLR